MPAYVTPTNAAKRLVHRSSRALFERAEKPHVSSLKQRRNTRPQQYGQKRIVKPLDYHISYH